ncbi:MAG: Rrf2 family transcriptional regulator [Chlamydiota bacterium]|nr:Rrf2 family transcriptional regulator [Chlamydiota bacterium]
MFRLYSKGCEYAIRALVHVAEKPEVNFAAKEVCRKARIPEAFSRKVFQSLVKAKYLQAVPGNSGGYRLGKDSDDINVLEIVKAVDGKNTFEHCVMGSSANCNARRPCLLHETWSKTKENLLSNLASKRLKDLKHVYQQPTRRKK